MKTAANNNDADLIRRCQQAQEAHTAEMASSAISCEISWRDPKYAAAVAQDRALHDDLKKRIKAICDIAPRTMAGHTAMASLALFIANDFGSPHPDAQSDTGLTYVPDPLVVQILTNLAGGAAISDQDAELHALRREAEEIQDRYKSKRLSDTASDRLSKRKWRISWRAAELPAHTAEGARSKAAVVLNLLKGGHADRDGNVYEQEDNDIKIAIAVLQDIVHGTAGGGRPVQQPDDRGAYIGLHRAEAGA